MEAKVKVEELSPKVNEERMEATATMEETTINIKEHQDEVEVEEERVMVKVEDTNLGLEEMDQKKKNLVMEIGGGCGEDKSLIGGGICISNEQEQRVKVKDEIKTELMDLDEADGIVVGQGTAPVPAVDEGKAQEVKKVKTEIVDGEGNTQIVDDVRTEGVKKEEKTEKANVRGAKQSGTGSAWSRRGHPNPKATFKKIECRVEIVEKVTRTFFCKLCMANVPSVSRLMVHLDREHNIRVNGPPRIVDDDGGDQKQDLENTSNLLKCIENEPRTCEPPSDFKGSDSYDSDSVSSEDSGLDHDHYQQQTPEEIYLKRKEQLHNRMIKQDLVWKAKIKAQMDDPVFKVKMSNYTHCDICWVEHEKFRLLRSVHKKQHADGDFKQCPHCSMHFLYEHYLDEHLQDMGVPVVPFEFSPSEAEDLLFQLHHCSFKDCNEAFTNRKCLLFHRTKEHDHKHYCPTCEKPFILYSALRKHIQRSHNWEKRMLKCPVPHCDKSFETRKGICIHGTHSHTKEEKELYIKNNVNFVNGEQTDPQTTCLPSVTADIRHQRPQTFWAIKSAQINYKSASKAKQKKVPRVREKATHSSTASSEPFMKININQISRPSSGRSKSLLTSGETKPKVDVNLQQQLSVNTALEPESEFKIKIEPGRGRVRRRKMKAKANKPAGRRRVRRVVESKPMMSYLSTFRIGLKYYCPVCHSPESPRAYGYLFNVHRHIKNDHPHSELLTRNWAITLKKTNQKCKPQQQSTSESSASDEDVKVTVNDESESEIELDPRIEQGDDNDVGGLSRSVSQSQGLPTSGKTKSNEEFRSKVNFQPQPSINTEPESEFKVKIEPESEFKVKMEPETESTHEPYICLKCSVESRWNYSSLWSLDRHINRKHGQQLLRQTEDEASNSSRDVDSNGSTTQSTSTATSLTTRRSRQRPKNSASNTRSVQAINDLSCGIKSEEITFETILSHVNLEEIQCPLCPEPKNKHKYVYATTTHLARHLNRSCPKAKTLNIITPNGNSQIGLWACKWCPRSFGSRQHLTIHFNKEHKYDVPKTELEDHQESIPSKLQTCERCGEFLKKLKDFKEHDCGLSTPVEVKKDSSPKKEWSSSSPFPKVRKDIKSEFGVDGSCPVPKVKVTAVSRPKRLSRTFITPRYKDSSSEDEFERLRPSWAIKREQAERDQELRLPQVISEEETSVFVCPTCSKQFESFTAMSAHKGWHTRRNKHGSSFLSRKDVDEPEKKRARLDLNDYEDADNYLGEELDPDMEQELDPNQDNGHYNTDNTLDVSSQAQQSHNLSLDLETSGPSTLAASAESDLVLLDVPTGSVVASMCSYCREWFDTPQAKVNHVLQTHAIHTIDVNE